MIKSAAVDELLQQALRKADDASEDLLAVLIRHAPQAVVMRSAEALTHHLPRDGGGR